MDVLLLGGTGWLGGEIARAAMSRGHRVTALARGSAPAPDGVTLIRADRSEPDGYRDVVDRDWDLVLDVSWQPGLVRSAVAALAGRAARWVYVSSGSVYAEGPAGDETDPTVAPLDADHAEPEDYGPAKVACENAVLDALGDRAVVARAGLIGGAGDRSDRFGYYPAAFARAGVEPVLVPDLGDAVVQTVSAGDLAAWLVTVDGSERSEDHGVFDTCGEPIRFADLIALARSAGGHTGRVVMADPSWLTSCGVGYFMGPRSLPFWLPEGHELAVPRPSERARAAGLKWRPYRRMIDEALTDERRLGFDRDRRAGLTRAQERELLEALP